MFKYTNKLSLSSGNVGDNGTEDRISSGSCDRSGNFDGSVNLVDSTGHVNILITAAISAVPTTLDRLITRLITWLITWLITRLITGLVMRTTGSTSSRLFPTKLFPGRLVNNWIGTGSNELLLTTDRSNVSVMEMNTLPGVEIVIPRPDPSGLSLKFMNDLPAVHGIDVSETTAIAGTEHDCFIVGEPVGTDEDTGSDRGNESDDDTNKSDVNGHYYMGCGGGWGVSFYTGRSVYLFGRVSF